MGAGMTLAKRRLMLNEPHLETAQSDGILTLYTDMRAPLKALRVGFEPVQDLHGYDKPWPGGGGKNVLPPIASGGSKNGVTWTVADDGTVTINGTATATMTIEGPLSTWVWDGTTPYWLSGCPSGGEYREKYALRVDYTSGAYSNPDTGNGIALSPFSTQSITGVPLKISIVLRSGVVCNNLVFRPMLEKGAAGTAYEPYSNICPITGWDAVNVQRAGKNLFDKANAEMVNGYFTVGDVTAIVPTINHRIVYIPCKPNTSYVISNSANNRVAVSYAKDSPGANGNVYASGTGTITTGADAKYLCVYCFNAITDSCTLQDVLDALQIELGSTATSYEPYTGSTTPISWADEAGTVYGGYLEWMRDGRVQVTATMAAITFDGSESGWGKMSNNPNGTCFAQNSAVPFLRWTGGGRNSAISNEFYADYDGQQTTAKNGTFWWNNARTAVRFIYGEPHNGTTTSEFKAFLANSPAVIMGELAEPITYTLTPTEALRTLRGENNIWSDANGAISATFWKH